MQEKKRNSYSKPATDQTRINAMYRCGSAVVITAIPLSAAVAYTATAAAAAEQLSYQPSRRAKRISLVELLVQ